MDIFGLVDWFERASKNPVGTPFYSDLTPYELAEAFADAFDLPSTPENVEGPDDGLWTVLDDGTPVRYGTTTPQNVEEPKCSTCHDIPMHRYRNLDPCPDCTPQNVEEPT